ncbi:thiamine-phosphate kinase [Micrococcus luteus]|nr:thiamine-phosphate kinase [Micrococcus luteus]
MTPAGGRPADGRTVGEVTEAQLLRVVLDGLAPAVRPGHWPPGTVAPGDDAALVPAPRGGTLVSTDAMGEGTDFLHRWPAGVRTRGHDAGWKAVAQNLSDVNAMGGTASALVTALTLPPTTPLAWVRSFAAGVVGAVDRLGAPGCRVAGGDLGTGERVHAAVTVLGDPHPAGVLRRAPAPAARERVLAEGADLVHAQDAPGSSGAARSGALRPSAARPGPGWAAAGLALLLTDRDELARRAAALPPEDRPGARDLARAVRAQLRPRPPLALGPAAVEAGILTLMDVSDGLGRDAHRMAAATGAAASAEAPPPVPWIDAAWLAEAAAPLRGVAALAGVSAESLVTGGGEDYGLLGLAWPETALPAGFVRIGRLEPAGAPAPAGHRELPEAGWDPFGG